MFHEGADAASLEGIKKNDEEREAGGAEGDSRGGRNERRKK